MVTDGDGPAVVRLRELDRRIAELDDDLAGLPPVARSPRSADAVERRELAQRRAMFVDERERCLDRTFRFTPG